MPSASDSRKDASFLGMTHDELNIGDVSAPRNRRRRARNHGVPDFARLAKFWIGLANQVAFEFAANGAAELFENSCRERRIRAYFESDLFVRV